MDSKISVVINTFNEEKNIYKVMQSVKDADEILVCDMHSDDNTPVIAKRMGAKVIFHKRTGFVEPARNFAISKTSNPWILIVDADEEIPESLFKKLKQIASESGVTTHVEIPRRNIIFGNWVKESMWWPDYHIRFFKKDAISWSDKIHSKPKTTGQGLTLPAEERYAIIHHHYGSISEFIQKMDRYTSIQAGELIKEGYKFNWEDVITKPLGEFLGRYFASRGYEDGLHGLALCLLQSFSHIVMYLKVWEKEGFEKRSIKFSDVHQTSKKAGKELNYWFKYGNLSKNPLKAFLQRGKNKFV